MTFLDEVDDADQIESAADRLAFLDATEFGTPGRWVTSAGAAADLSLLFNAPVSAEAGIAMADITMASPSAICRQADLPAGAAQGDRLTARGVVWRVRDIRPDGTGMTIIDLQR